MSCLAIETDDDGYKRIYVDSVGGESLQHFNNMTHGEIAKNEYTDVFIIAALNAAGKSLASLKNKAAISLVGDDGALIWTIVIHPTDEEGYNTWTTTDWARHNKKHYYDDKLPLDKQ